MVRAKLKDTYEWVFSDNENTIYSYDIIPETICCGLEIIDQSNKEIFEDDIIAYEYGENVCWCIATKWAKLAFKKANEKQSDGFVIGNVFDNPNLLEILEDERNVKEIIRRLQ